MIWTLTYLSRSSCCGDCNNKQTLPFSWFLFLLVSLLKHCLPKHDTIQYFFFSFFLFIDFGAWLLFNAFVVAKLTSLNQSGILLKIFLWVRKTNCWSDITLFFGFLNYFILLLFPLLWLKKVFYIDYCCLSWPFCHRVLYYSFDLYSPVTSCLTFFFLQIIFSKIIMQFFFFS